MMDKKFFEMPEVTLLLFANEDVVTSSPAEPDPTETDLELPGMPIDN